MAALSAAAAASAARESVRANIQECEDDLPSLRKLGQVWKSWFRLEHVTRLAKN